MCTHFVPVNPATDQSKISRILQRFKHKMHNYRFIHHPHRTTISDQADRRATPVITTRRGPVARPPYTLAPADFWNYPKHIM